MLKLNKYFSTIVLATGLAVITAPVAALPPPADAEVVLADAYKGKSYSPYAGRGFASRPLWGDSHLHTAFIGFEWTSLVKGVNMHRGVIYRDNGDKASQLVAYTTTLPQGSINPRDLWK